MLEKVAIIKGRAGLGNRILPAVAGLVHAELAGRRPLIDWRDGWYAEPGTNAYALLFEAPGLPDLRAWDAATDVHPAVWAGGLAVAGDTHAERDGYWARRNPRHYRRYSTRPDRPDPGSAVTVTCTTMPKVAQLRRAWRRSGRPEPFDWPAEAGRQLAGHFVPRPELRARVEAVLDRLPRPALGIHVRHTDRRTSLARALSATARLRRETGAEGLFLATDDGAVEQVFRRHFPELVVAPKPDWQHGRPRHNKGGGGERLRHAGDAIVDMWVLAAMDALACSSHSSFTDLPRLMIGPEGAVRDIDLYAPVVAVKRMLRAFA